MAGKSVIAVLIPLFIIRPAFDATFSKDVYEFKSLTYVCVILLIIFPWAKVFINPS